MMTPPQHTISLYVRNQPGVLSRVSLIFARRGFNIDSLVVSTAARGEFSRMTITSSGEREGLEQIVKQLAKLIDVVHAIDHTGRNVIEVEIALVKIACGIEQRTPILQIAEPYKVKVIDFQPDSMVLRLHGSTQKLDAAMALLNEFEVIELVRSGKILMARGSTET